MTAVDHSLVKRFRQDAGDRIAEQRRLDQVNGVTPMSTEDERQYARAVIAQILEEYARSEINAGRTPLDAETEEQYAAAVHAALFGVGRLQPLLDDPEVENIDINGCDQVFVGYADGREVRGEPVAETDEELIELIQVLGAYSGLSSRPFDSANPQLDLRLPDGSRLSAVMDVARFYPRCPSAGPAWARCSSPTWSATAPSRPSWGTSSPARSAPARTS